MLTFLTEGYHNLLPMWPTIWRNCLTQGLTDSCLNYCCFFIPTPLLHPCLSTVYCPSSNKWPWRFVLHLFKTSHEPSFDYSSHSDWSPPMGLWKRYNDLDPSTQKCPIQLLLTTLWVWHSLLSCEPPITIRGYELVSPFAWCIIFPDTYMAHS